MFPQRVMVSMLTNRMPEVPGRAGPQTRLDKADGRRLMGMAVFSCALLAVFLKPLFDLFRYSLGSDLYSYVLLVPLISLYLIWQRREDLKVPLSMAWKPALPFLVFGLSLLWANWSLNGSGARSSAGDQHTFTAAGFVSLLIGGCFFFCGVRLVKTIWFAIAFLYFMAPLPRVLTDWIMHALQYLSADASYLLLKLSGTPVLRDGLVFHLPGINLEVAEECSGIHSTLVLFISSLLAGHLFLRSPLKKAILVFLVFPLGVLRKGFRIWTISMLCVHVDPGMIDSPIHRRGGPLFFVASLVPFIAILLLMRRAELRKPAREVTSPSEAPR